MMYSTLDSLVVMEAIKKNLGITGGLKVRVKTGRLLKGWSSELIKFPNVCPSCLKSAKDKWKVTTTLAQTKKVIGKDKKGKTETIDFEAPICEECLKKRKKRKRSIPLQTSLIVLFLVLFSVWQIRAPIMRMWLQYARFLSLFPLGFPLILLVLYIMDKRDEDPIIISEITLGKDNRRLLRRLINTRNNRGAFVQAKLDPKSQTSVTFSFRNPKYASLFEKENKTLLF